MAETTKPSSGFNSEDSDDEIYEKIEAPKFVDFTRPDPPLLDQDRSWFCVRVGCDQQHEEIDPDALYKSFRLRVLAARSPNLRLQKALSKRAQSATVRCPLSAPAKPSRPRLPRLLISSISRSIASSKANAHNPLKLAATPKVRAKASSVATKALTTPSHKRPIPKSDPFRSVRIPQKSTTISKTRVVAKALVFNSPSKTEKKRSSSECSSQTAAMCVGMNKLAIGSQNLQKKTLRNAYNAATASSASKSKVSAQKLNGGGKETSKESREQNPKSLRCLKSKSLRKLQKRNILEEVHNESSNVDTDRKSLDDSIHVNHAPDRSRSHEENESTADVETANDSSQEKQFSSSEASSVTDKAEVILTDTSSNGHSSSLSDSDRGLASGDLNESETSNGNRDGAEKENYNDDKENAAASDNNSNRNPDPSKEHAERKMCESRADINHQKANKAPSRTPQGSCSSTIHGTKYKKPMPTNPKPFRLRTDERGTLREANLEKKHGIAPLKEITTVPDGKSETLHVKERRTRADCLKTPKSIMDSRLTSALPESRKELKDREVTETVEETKSLRSAESPSSQKLAKPLRTYGTRKGMKAAASPNQNRLEAVKEATVSTPMGTIPEKKCSTLRESPAATNASISRSSSQKRRPTFPREPSFQKIHTPKSCTKASNISSHNDS